MSDYEQKQQKIIVFQKQALETNNNIIKQLKLEIENKKQLLSQSQIPLEFLNDPQSNSCDDELQQCLKQEAELFTLQNFVPLIQKRQQENKSENQVLFEFLQREIDLHKQALTKFEQNSRPQQIISTSIFNSELLSQKEEDLKPLPKQPKQQSTQQQQQQQNESNQILQQQQQKFINDNKTCKSTIPDLKPIGGRIQQNFNNNSQQIDIKLAQQEVQKLIQIIDDIIHNHSQQIKFCEYLKITQPDNTAEFSSALTSYLKSNFNSALKSLNEFISVEKEHTVFELVQIQIKFEPVCTSNLQEMIVSGVFGCLLNGQKVTEFKEGKVFPMWK